METMPTQDALRSQFKKLAIQELEMRDRKGYETIPEDSAESFVWLSEAVWPEEQALAIFGFISFLRQPSLI
jgi:hypothetical protein